MSAIEEAARHLVEAFAVRDLEATADAMYALTAAVIAADAERERLVKRPATAGAELLDLDDVGGH